MVYNILKYIMANEKSNMTDYLFYLIDLIALVIAMVFSLTEAYSVETSQLLYKIPLVLLSVFFKYIYLIYYGVTKYMVG